MDINPELARQLLQRCDDAIDAFSEIERAAKSIRLLQELEAWLLLDLEIRRELCRSHAILATLERMLWKQIVAPQRAEEVAA